MELKRRLNRHAGG